MATVEQILMVKGPDVIVAAPTSTVLEAARLMAEANVGSVIVRETGEVLGIFTERDLLQRVVADGRDPSSVLLADVMTSPVKSCRLSDDLQACARGLSAGHIRHLAVVEEGALVGLIGVRDILSAQLRSREEEVESLRSGSGAPA